MAPSASKGSQTTYKGKLTTQVNRAKALEFETTTKQLMREVVDIEGKFIDLIQKFKEKTEIVSRDLATAGADAATIQAEEDYVENVFDEIRSAKSILQEKKGEWQQIQKDEEEAKEETKRKQKEDVEEAKRIQKEDAADQKMRDFMKMLQQEMIASRALIQPAAGASVATRLPQRQIRNFKGDRAEWLTFWESYKAAIHSSRLSDVEKFSYLKDYLKGDAYLIVQHLELTDANYKIAIDELEKQYGGKDQLVAIHMDALSTLQPSRDGADSAALKTFLLTIQSHMNALESLGEPRTGYGAFLGTSIVKFLPTRLQREWSRDPANKPTDINKVLEFLQKEVEIAERLSSLKPEKTKPSQSPAQQSKQQPQPATASQLAIGAKSHPTPGNKSPFSQSKTRHPSAKGTKPKYQLNNHEFYLKHGTRRQGVLYR